MVYEVKGKIIYLRSNYNEIEIRCSGSPYMDYNIRIPMRVGTDMTNYKLGMIVMVNLEFID